MENKNKGVLSSKIFLYLTEFFSGMSVMAVELGANRLLAPYFSSSQIVWTIIIGTIMIAMALGNIWGGRKADKNPDPDKLYGRVIIAAIWIAATPLLGKYVILGVSGVVIVAVNTNYLIWAALAASLVIFVYPLFLLGTVTPSLAKYTVDSLDDSGKVVGTLGAFNTVGSIIGTFIPTFVTIPAVGTSVTFLIFAGILLVLAFVYFISRKKFRIKMAVGVVVMIVCIIFGSADSFAFWEEDLTYEGESVYNYLQVKDSDSTTILSTNVLFGVQSMYMKSETLTGMYYDYAMAAPLMTGKEEAADNKVLILGMGTGTYATQCERYYGDMDITGVEIDEDITELAREYFNLSDDIEVITYDGRAYLNAVDEKYDVIMVDAYQDISIPFQMATVDFFTLVKEHLTEDGVMIVNMNMRGSDEGNVNQYLSDTISRVFTDVYTIDVSGTTNRELFASMDDGMLESLEASLDSIEDSDLKALMEKVDANLAEYEAGDYIMTDDKAPVELLSMRAMDELIGDEVSYYKNLLNEEGLSAVLESLGF